MAYKDKEKKLAYAKQYREANREKLNIGNREYRVKNKQALSLYNREYRQTPKGRYVEQKTQAKSRGIPWEISFEDWWTIWQESGHWEHRGSGKYMMCRTGDSGPYSIENVRIDSATGNIRERFSVNV